MDAQSHDILVDRQFGPRADAYLTSPAHAEGDDLIQLAQLAPDGADSLDLGCGAGHVAYALAPRVARVVACDRSPEMLALVRSTAAARGLDRIETSLSAVERLPFADGAFDFVVSRYSAHHWTDFAAGLREARRVLRTTGRAAFVDIFAPDSALLDTHLQTFELLRDPSHVRNRTEREWRGALREAGFQPGPITKRRLRLDFQAWVTRMTTAEAHVRAIRSLFAGMPAEMRRYIEIEPDCSFTLDTMVLEAAPV